MEPDIHKSTAKSTGDKLRKKYSLRGDLEWKRLLTMEVRRKGRSEGETERKAKKGYRRDTSCSERFN